MTNQHLVLYMLSFLGVQHLTKPFFESSISTWWSFIQCSDYQSVSRFLGTPDLDIFVAEPDLAFQPLPSLTHPTRELVNAEPTQAHDPTN